MQTTERITNPLGLDLADAAGYTTGGNWPFYDQGHVNEIAADMREHGWRGAPLVVLPDYALSYTGTHRLRAAQAAELDTVPAVQLHDLFEACGLDLDALCDEHDLGLTSDRHQIVNLLPADIAAAYCLDDIED